MFGPFSRVFFGAVRVQSPGCGRCRKTFVVFCLNSCAICTQICTTFRSKSVQSALQLAPFYCGSCAPICTAFRTTISTKSLYSAEMSLTVQMKWCKWSGANEVVQMKWCKSSGANEVVQVVVQTCCFVGKFAPMFAPEWCKWRRDLHHNEHQENGICISCCTAVVRGGKNGRWLIGRWGAWFERVHWTTATVFSWRKCHIALRVCNKEPMKRWSNSDEWKIHRLPCMAFLHIFLCKRLEAIPDPSVCHSPQFKALFRASMATKPHLLQNTPTAMLMTNRRS